MGCNCKKNVVDTNTLMSNTKTENKNVGQNIVKYSLKTIAFLLLLALLPIINLVIIWFMFRTLVLNKEIDIKPLLLSIGKKFENKDLDDDDYENLTEEDVIMTDVEKIEKISGTRIIKE